MMSRFLLAYMFLVLFIFQSCQEPFVPETLEASQEFVVEGYVEVNPNGNALPAYVILTKSFPFFDQIGPETFQEAYIKSAEVLVFDGDNTVSLSEVCLSELPDEFKDQIVSSFGFNPGNIENDICIYVDLFFELIYEEGRSYDLDITTGDTKITATTTIPETIPLSNFRWVEPPDEANDTLLQLWTTIVDPPGPNFYRLKTASMGNRLIPPPFSVVNDPFFDDQEFEFPLNRAPYLEEGIDLNTAGLFLKGDDVVIQWISIDEAHYDFWNTLDFNAANQGPFSSYTRVTSNVEGALGVWGGYGIAEYSFTVPN